MSIENRRKEKSLKGSIEQLWLMVLNSILTRCNYLYFFIEYQSDVEPKITYFDMLLWVRTKRYSVSWDSNQDICNKFLVTFGTENVHTLNA